MNILFKAFINLLAFLPIRILYCISDYILYPLARFILNYRRDVVEKNLLLAFPEKHDKFRRDIEKKFYHSLCDIIVETIKMKRFSQEELKKRYLWINADEVINQTQKEKNMTMCLFAHLGNWEWSIARFMPNNNIIPFCFYYPLHNKFIEKWIIQNRSRFGNNLVDIAKLKQVLDRIENSKQRCMINIAIDQLPKEKYVKYFCQFMGIKTKVISGTESIITQYDMNAYFCYVVRTKRGYYECRSIKMEPCLKEKSNKPYTDMYFELLEKNIREQPELWLWSHNRWKR